VVDNRFSPAFPVLDAGNTKGINVREYFAAAALQGLLASGKEWKGAAVNAVQAAEELIKALNAKGQ
jgi:hypothetical protein